MSTIPTTAISEQAGSDTYTPNRLPAGRLGDDLFQGFGAGGCIGFLSGTIAGTCTFPLYGTVIGMIVGAVIGAIGGLILGLIIHVLGWRNDGTLRQQARTIGGSVGVTSVLLAAGLMSIGAGVWAIGVGVMVAVPAAFGAAWVATHIMAAQAEHWVTTKPITADNRLFKWCLGTSTLPLLAWVLTFMAG